MGAIESGKSLADQILAKLPEHLRGQVQTVFAAPEAIDALTLLGDSALARSDYSKHMDEITTKQKELDALKAQLDSDYTNLDGWWKANEPKVKEYETVKSELEALKAKGGPPKNEPPAGGLTEEKLAEILQKRDEGYARVLSVTSTLTAKHLRDFNEVLDVNALVEHATKNRVALYDPKAETDAYRAIHGEKLTAKAKAEEDARVNKLVDEKLAERQKSQQQPFPVRGPDPSVLDSLEQPDRSARYTADAAAARYEELVAASAGRG